MRTNLRTLALAVVAVMVAAACTSTPATTSPTPTVTVAPSTAAPSATPAGSPSPTPKPTGLKSKEGTLTIWVDGARVKMVTDLGKKFTDKYKVPVVVQELGFGDIRDQLKIAGPAKEGPDIIIGAHDWLGELVTNGLVEPLDLGAKAKNVDPVALRGFTYDGKLYGLPYLVEAVALIYNKDLVPTPPKTWDELKAVAKKLQDDKKVEQGYVLQQGDPYHTEPILTGFGGYVFAYKNGQYDPKDLGLDSPGGIAAYTEIENMVKAGLLRKDVDYNLMMSLFKEKKSAMFISGPWTLGDLRAAKVNYGIAPIPTMKQTPRPFVGVQGWMVSAFGKNKLQAKTFLTEFVATDEAMQALYDAVPGAISWLPIAGKLKEKDPDIAAFLASASTGDPMPAIPQMSSVWEAWGKAITLIFQGQSTADKAIKDAAATIREKLK